MLKEIEKKYVLLFRTNRDDHEQQATNQEKIEKRKYIWNFETSSSSAIGCDYCEVRIQRYDVIYFNRLNTPFV